MMASMPSCHIILYLSLLLRSCCFVSVSCIEMVRQRNRGLLGFATCAVWYMASEWKDKIFAAGIAVAADAECCCCSCLFLWEALVWQQCGNARSANSYFRYDHVSSELNKQMSIDKGRNSNKQQRSVHKEKTATTITIKIYTMSDKKQLSSTSINNHSQQQQQTSTFNIHTSSNHQHKTATTTAATTRTNNSNNNNQQQPTTTTMSNNQQQQPQQQQLQQRQQQQQQPTYNLNFELRNGVPYYGTIRQSGKPGFSTKLALSSFVSPHFQGRLLFELAVGFLLACLQVDPTFQLACLPWQ